MLNNNNVQNGLMPVCDVKKKGNKRMYKIK